MNNNNPSLSLTLLPAPEELAQFEKTTHHMMNSDRDDMSPKDLASHITHCKRVLQDLESVFKDRKLFAEITDSQAYDLFAQYCEELIEYANFDKSDLKLIKCAKELELQLEKVFLRK